MSRQISISEDSYKKFQAALLLTGEDEETVLSKLISKYAHAVFEKVMGKPADAEFDTGKKVSVDNITADEQKQLFIKWFRGLTRNGKAYNPVTISGYTGRIENACCEPVFATIPINNLFSVTELEEFVSIQKQIKECAGYAEFDARSHNGFSAALKKYEEFLSLGGSKSPKELVGIFGLDIESDDFWNIGMNEVRLLLEDLKSVLKES